MKAKIQFSDVVMDVEVRSASKSMISFYLPEANDCAQVWQELINRGALISAMRKGSFVALDIKEDVVIEYHK